MAGAALQISPDQIGFIERHSGEVQHRRKQHPITMRIAICVLRVSQNFLLWKTWPQQWTWLESSQKLCGNCKVEAPGPPKQCQ